MQHCPWRVELSSQCYHIKRDLKQLRCWNNSSKFGQMQDTKKRHQSQLIRHCDDAISSLSAPKLHLPEQEQRRGLRVVLTTKADIKPDNGKQLNRCIFPWPELREHIAREPLLSNPFEHNREQRDLTGVGGIKL